MDRKEVLEILSQFQLGDRVSVQWHAGGMGEAKVCYQREGTVVQVTPKLIAIRRPSGYVFCVNLGHIASGTVVSLKKRAEMTA